jgi:serine/threonine protein kinase
VLQGTTERLGPCRLLRELGSGGMGTVFLGELVEDRPYAARGTHVAVKTLHPALLASEESVRRFRLEAALGARVLHPCVVRTYEAGEAGTAPGPTAFLILE